MLEIALALISGASLVLTAWVTNAVQRVKRESRETHEHMVNHHGKKNFRDEQDSRHKQVTDMLTSLHESSVKTEDKLDNVFRRIGILEELEITNPRKRD